MGAEESTPSKNYRESLTKDEVGGVCCHCWLINVGCGLVCRVGTLLVLLCILGRGGGHMLPRVLCKYLFLNVRVESLYCYLPFLALLDSAMF